MESSEDWKRYFERNRGALLPIPWHLGGDLSADERAAVARSVREFQAGESSEGKHLYRNAVLYAARTGDHAYVAAIRLFIAEEQRHARDLAHILTLNGLPLVRTTWTDRAFRRLRNLGKSLEVSIGVLVTAEFIAMAYYGALQKATTSVVLGAVCEQILGDEVEHVRFQVQQLARLRAGRGRWRAHLTAAAQRALFLAAVLIVWPVHGCVMRRAGMGFASWWSECWRSFRWAAGEAVAAPRQSDEGGGVLGLSG